MISDLTSFDVVQNHYNQVDPIIACVLPSINWSEWFEEHPSEDHFYNLTRNIIYQQLAGKAASTIFARFESLFSGRVTPEVIIQFEDQALRDVGLSWAKVRYVKDLAHKVLSSEVRLDGIQDLPDETVITELSKVKGIGRWTAEMFLLFTLHREDIFSFGDLGLQNGFAKLYNQPHPSSDLISQVVASWSPYRSYGSIALWHYLDNSP